MLLMKPGSSGALRILGVAAITRHGAAIAVAAAAADARRARFAPSSSSLPPRACAAHSCCSITSPLKTPTRRAGADATLQALREQIEASARDLSKVLDQTTAALDRA